MFSKSGRHLRLEVDEVLEAAAAGNGAFDQAISKLLTDFAEGPMDVAEAGVMVLEGLLGRRISMSDPLYTLIDQVAWCASEKVDGLVVRAFGLDDMALNEGLEDWRSSKRPPMSREERDAFFAEWKAGDNDEA